MKTRVRADARSCGLGRRDLLATLACAALFDAPALAQDTAAKPTALVAMTNVDARETLDLSGRWRAILDPQRHGGSGWAPRAVQQDRPYDPTLGSGLEIQEYDFGTAPLLDVPGEWNLQNPELRWYDDRIWMRREFAYAPQRGRRAFVHFAAVNHQARVFLNGAEIGAFDGGFTPFMFEVTDHLAAGRNSLVVAVDGQLDATSLPPHTTGWDNASGIVGPVTLITTPSTFIDQCVVRLEPADVISARVTLNGPRRAGASITVRIPDVGLTLEGRTDADGVAALSAPAPVSLERWSPDRPRLYEVLIETGAESVRDRIGFRTIAVRGRDILLNGEPIFLRGVNINEEAFGPEGTRAVSPAEWRALLVEAKNGLNCNFVRTAHTPPSEAAARIADEIGLLLQCEVPVWQVIDYDHPRVIAIARDMMTRMIARDANRASIIIWSAGNETRQHPGRDALLAQLISDIRTADSSRLATYVSDGKTAIGQRRLINRDPIFDLVDVVCINQYEGWYGTTRLEDVSGLRWETPYDKPLVMSEFGAEGAWGFNDPSLPKFSLDFQAALYRETFAMFRHVPQLCGTAAWVLKDYRDPARMHPVFQDGWNCKGVVAPDGRRKPAYDVLRAWNDEIARGEWPSRRSHLP